MIPLHDTHSFTATHMPARELQTLFHGDISQYFMVRTEDMYRHVKQAVPASRSTTHTCLYTTEGIARMKIGSEFYEVGKDEMLFVPAGQVFSFGTGEENKGFLFVFHRDLFISKLTQTDPFQDFEFLKVWGNPHIRLEDAQAKRVLYLVQRLFEDYIENGLKNTGIIRSYLAALLHEINLNRETAAPRRATAAEDLANRFRELLHTHVTTEKQVTGYASLLNVTPNHLNKSVKSVTGKSPTKWIDEALVSEAKILLLQSRLSVQEIAQAIGFEDPSYFTRLFRKYEQVTPTAFRKMIEKS